MLEIWYFSPQNSSEFPPASIKSTSRGISCFPRGPASRGSPSRRHFFEPNEVTMIAIGDRIEKKKKRFYFFFIFSRSGRICCLILWGVWIVFDPVGSKKCGRQFPVPGCPHGQAGSTPRLILERDSTHSEARKTDIQYFPGQKAHAKVLKVLFLLTANPTA